MSFILDNREKFKITIEVVPPEGNSDELMTKLQAISHLAFDGFSVASNPIAKPRMSAMVFAHLLQKKIQKPSILHLTIRDHNTIGLQGEMWGAAALGIDTVIAMTGDPAKRAVDHASRVSTVADVNVFELIRMARATALSTGAVLDFRPEIHGLNAEVKRLEKKVASGAQFIVTQPIYDEKTATEIKQATQRLNVPVIMGLLPLISYKHARFLHDKVDGITVPQRLIHDLEKSTDPVATGIDQAKQILKIARQLFSGACVMPPFDRFEILEKLLYGRPSREDE